MDDRVRQMCQSQAKTNMKHLMINMRVKRKFNKVSFSLWHNNLTRYKSILHTTKVAVYIPLTLKLNFQKSINKTFHKNTNTLYLCPNTKKKRTCLEFCKAPDQRSACSPQGSATLRHFLSFLFISVPSLRATLSSSGDLSREPPPLWQLPVGTQK